MGGRLKKVRRHFEKEDVAEAGTSDDGENAELGTANEEDEEEEEGCEEEHEEEEEEEQEEEEAEGAGDEEEAEVDACSHKAIKAPTRKRLQPETVQKSTAQPSAEDETNRRWAFLEPRKAPKEEPKADMVPVAAKFRVGMVGAKSKLSVILCFGCPAKSNAPLGKPSSLR